jgi:uncharacterized membrane-anchored protein
MPTRPALRMVIALAWSLPALLCPQSSFAADEPGEEPSIAWTSGPATCKLGHVARLELPTGFQFTDKDGTRQILESLENPTSGAEVGLVIPDPGESDTPSWFAVFEYDPIGYVRDTDKDKLDADAILESIRRGNEKGNEVRRKNGWTEIQVIGWHKPPFYDERTHNLTWAIIGATNENRSVNYSVRLLGRGGTMSAELVVDPEELDASLPAFETMIAGFNFTPDNDYASFRQGDKVAKYGLTALVAGGAGAVAMKTGLLARFWKLIVVGFLALAGSVKRLFGRLLPGRRTPEGPDPGKLECTSTPSWSQSSAAACWPKPSAPRDRDS